jgi:hypothetical protein
VGATIELLKMKNTYSSFIQYDREKLVDIFWVEPRVAEDIICFEWWGK